jgi:hypothetical protein
MKREQYPGNTAKKQVHDLDNEKTRKNECQIDEVMTQRTTSRSICGRSRRILRTETDGKPDASRNISG